MLYTRSIEFMQAGYCTCIPTCKALKVSGVCLRVHTVVWKASEAFIHTSVIDSTMHRGVVFLIAQATAAIH